MADAGDCDFALSKVLFCVIISQKVNAEVGHINMLCDEDHHFSSLLVEFCRHGSITNQRHISAVPRRNFLVSRNNAAALHHAGGIGLASLPVSKRQRLGVPLNLTRM